MPTVAVEMDNCKYTCSVTILDASTIISARQRFEAYKQTGVFKNASFDDNIWIINDETQIRNLLFPTPSPTLEKKCHSMLGCSAKEYVIFCKSYLALYFGASTSTLQVIVCELRKLADYLVGQSNLEETVSVPALIADFLSLLPNQTLTIDALIDMLMGLSEELSPEGGMHKQRKLAQCQSYLRFDRVMDSFWANAAPEEKTKYFPIWFWWKVTSILPLRPTECTLTPRNCIATDGKLIVRRTKLKGKRLGNTYHLNSDYYLSSYTVPALITNTIKEYIDATARNYSSDIETLFCPGVSEQINPTNRLNLHFTYQDMRHRLSTFYEEVVLKQFHYNICTHKSTESFSFTEDSIEEIKLGDTRHLAMINLILTGGNPEICMELAGHEDINISSHYYSNISTFIEAMAFERIRSSSVFDTPINQRHALSITNKTRLADGGFCTSKKVMSRDYTDCFNSLDKYGRMLSCRKCPHYISPNTETLFSTQQLISPKEADKDLKESFNYLLETIGEVRKGLGCSSDIRSAFLKIQAEANLYGNTIVKQYAMENVYEQAE